MVWNAFLFNTRNGDLAHLPGTKLKEGTIVEGEQGFVVAEHRVLGWKAATECRWNPNREVEWRDKVIRCMAHMKAPRAYTPSRMLQKMGFNYVVAGTDDLDWVKDEVQTGFPFVQMAPSFYLFNLEIGRFATQDRRRRANLVF